MKHLSRLISGIFILLFFHGSVLGAEVHKIGVIDLQKCITESKEGRKVFEALKEKKGLMQKKLDKKQTELLQIKEQLEKQTMMLSMDAREDKRKEFDNSDTMVGLQALVIPPLAGPWSKRKT